MDSHVRILGVLHIVFGGLGALVALGFLLFFGGLASFVGLSGAGGGADAAVAAPIIGVIGAAIAVLILLVSLPGIICGYGLMNYRPWARILGIVLSAIQILNVPFGTILGIYGLWVLLSTETERLFQAAPLNR